MRRRLALLVLAVACGPTAPLDAPRAKHPQVASGPDVHTTVAPKAQRAEADRDRDFVGAWAMWAAGKQDEALAVLKQLVVEMRDLSTKAAPVEVQTGVLDLAINADGTRAVVVAGGGAYWFDAAGAPLRYDAAPDASTAAFIPHSPLVVLGGYTSQVATLSIIDSTTFTHVLDVTGGRVEVAYATSPSGTSVAYKQYPANGPPQLHVWDVAARKERQVFTLRDEDECSEISVGHVGTKSDRIVPIAACR